MLVFDELKYASDIINNKRYSTIKNQGRERCIITRYLTSIGYTAEQIREVLALIPMSGGEYLSVEDKYKIFDKIIDKANEYEFIFGKSVVLYEEEINVVNSIEDETLRKLLFYYLVYYKWGCQVKHLQFWSKKKNLFMVMENNKDLWKVAGLQNHKVSDRYLMCNKLFNLGLYKVENFKSHNYIYLPFVRNEGKIAIRIENYSNIYGELEIYNNPDDFKRCEVCGTVIKKTRSPKKYCQDCAKFQNQKSAKERKKKALVLKPNTL